MEKLCVLDSGVLLNYPARIDNLNIYYEGYEVVIPTPIKDELKNFHNKSSESVYERVLELENLGFNSMNNRVNFVKQDKEYTDVALIRYIMELKEIEDREVVLHTEDILLKSRAQNSDIELFDNN